MAQFNYPEFEKMLAAKQATLDDPHLIHSINTVIHGLQNEWRMHWIDDVLLEDHHETVETLTAKLNIEIPTKQSKP